MSKQVNIVIQSQSAIDVVAWNNCIAQSPQRRVYAYYEYLTAMSTSWHALIINDYACVMPLPWRRKWGIDYLYQPPFVQQLGLFGDAALALANKTAIIQAIQKCFRFAEVFVNQDFNVLLHNALHPATNFILSLQPTIEQTLQHASNDFKKNLRKANKQSFDYREGSLQDAIACYQQLYAQRTPHVKTEDYANFEQLMHGLPNGAQLIVRQVRNNQALLAIGVFVRDATRMYNLMNATLPAGRSLAANYFLLVELWKEFAGSGYFDFEGSDLNGIREFYAKTGAIYEPYFFWRYNHLPFYVKWLKK